MARINDNIELLSTYSLRYLKMTADPSEFLESTINARMFIMNEMMLMGVNANTYKPIAYELAATEWKWLLHKWELAHAPRKWTVCCKYERLLIHTDNSEPRHANAHDATSLLGRSE